MMALQMLNELKKSLERGDETAVAIAQVYVSLGEQDEAWAMLERAFDLRSPWLVHLMRNPIFDPLRDDPRFQDLLEKMGLE